MKIYDYLEHREAKKKEWNYNTVAKSGMLNRNKKLMLQYIEELESNKLKASSIQNRIAVVKRLGILLKKEFLNTTKEDILAFIKTLDDLDPRVSNMYRLRLKSFYKWLNQQQGKKGFPKCVDWIEVINKSKTEKPKEILTKEEIKLLVEKTDHPRDKTLITLLADSGCRISELLELKLKDIKFDEFGALISVKGKTGERQIRLIDSVTNLKMWINNHPFRNDNNSPLFFGEEKIMVPLWDTSAFMNN